MMVLSGKTLRPKLTIYTLGYQGTDLPTYIRTLKNAGIAVVIDVRETAWSYKRGFCKTALREGLEKQGIRYVHLRSAGNPKENRKTAHSNAECLERYKKHLAQNQRGLNDLLEALSEAWRHDQTPCLTCFEREPESCHRSILVKALGKRLKKIDPVHLSC